MLFWRQVCREMASTLMGAQCGKRNCPQEESDWPQEGFCLSRAGIALWWARFLTCPVPGSHLPPTDFPPALVSHAILPGVSCGGRIRRGSRCRMGTGRSALQAASRPTQSPPRGTPARGCSPPPRTTALAYVTKTARKAAFRSEVILRAPEFL